MRRLPGQGGDPLLVPQALPQRLPGGGVPEVDIAVHVPARDVPPVWRPGHHEHPVAVSLAEWGVEGATGWTQRGGNAEGPSGGPSIHQDHADNIPLSGASQEAQTIITKLGYKHALSIRLPCTRAERMPMVGSHLALVLGHLGVEVPEANGRVPAPAGELLPVGAELDLHPAGGKRKMMY